MIDFHGHLRRMDPQDALRVMEATNVQTIIDFDGGSGAALEEQKARYAGLPGRVVHFARLNWRWINNADFSSRSARQLEEDVKAGARGLKISKMLGLYLRDDEGKLVAVNDPRFDPIWAKCGELGIPVAIHIADPDAFFLPLDTASSLDWTEVACRLTTTGSISVSWKPATSTFPTTIDPAWGAGKSTGFTCPMISSGKSITRMPKDFWV